MVARRHYLAAWLPVQGIFCCLVTGYTPVVQFSPIMIPQSEREKVDSVCVGATDYRCSYIPRPLRLPVYEYVLLSGNRLFLIQCKPHSLLLVTIN